jgi:hypothetical protein
MAAVGVEVLGRGPEFGHGAGHREAERRREVGDPVDVRADRPAA